VIEQKYEILEDALIDLTRLLKEEFENIKSLKIKITKPDIINNAKVAVEYEV
jgi:dihydroneopterin aldolase